MPRLIWAFAVRICPKTRAAHMSGRGKEPLCHTEATRSGFVCVTAVDKTHFQPKYRLALWVNFSADDILKCFSCFYQESDFDLSCKLAALKTICTNCQNLFSGKNKKQYHRCVVCWISPEIGKGYTNILIISAQKYMLWYSLEAPRRGASNEYQQHIFSCRNKKNMYSGTWMIQNPRDQTVLFKLLRLWITEV